MDRFSWTDGFLIGDECLVTHQSGVRLYDGEDKTAFDNGKLTLTTTRLMWRNMKDTKGIICLSLTQIIYTEEQPATLTKSAKIVLHLSPPEADKGTGPVTSSKYAYIRLSFKERGEQDFYRFLTEQLLKLRNKTEQQQKAGPSQPARVMRTGIGGIEKKLQQKYKETDTSISASFTDLSNLMAKAKEMVTLSKNISDAIRNKQGDITEDETIRFKSYLLSLGIADPVTRETHGGGNKYYRELAKQISTMLEEPLKECGGMMTLPDIYCRVNRARGMELLSPEDLVNACKLMEGLHLPVRLRVFDTTVMVVQLLSHSEAEVIKQTEHLVEEEGSVTAEELSALLNLSVVLSRERLLSSEREGKLCRDETVEGLRFYPNWLLTRS
ncbi:hypothetical protein NP493_76g05024 [Ridgeia piscesae]|uniref:Vacuolar protein-sorting-associated protein 36 n=1 Tax=Ridgeia piscesae TaxID=27915 RepID=A0AAD9P974_RIDPI|nr:hypothetical protein NP493_76g05024 [Ridgeia piscesae]